MSDRDSIFSRAAVSAGAAAAEDWAAASDAELFRHYQTMPGGEVFRILASRHLPLIWSTAQRLVNGDAALAEDVTQIVLTDFARKAPQLPPGTVAAGWLHRHTCFTARKMVRTEVRRRHREHRAADFATAADSSSFSSFATTPAAAGTPSFEPMTTDSESAAAAWPEAAPLLDAALDQLVKADREAILLRFYQRQDHRSIGQAMGCTEEAARKRITRALEKLRTLFRRRGVLLTAALLTQCLTDHATAAVPAPVAAALPGMAWRQATLTGPVTASSAATAWFRRCLLPGAAVVAILAGGVWAIAESGWFWEKGIVSGSIQPASLQPAANSVPAGPVLLFRYTMADIPAKYLSVRLLTWESSPDHDAELLTEVRGLGKSGGSVRDFDLSGPLNREVSLHETREHKLPTSWVWDEKNDMAKAQSTESKTLGTEISGTARQSKNGTMELTWRVSHYYAEPAPHAWPIALEPSAKDPERSIRMEDFHQTAANGRIGGIMDNEPRLLFIQHLCASVLPDAQPEPRTLLLFVTVNPS